MEEGKSVILDVNGDKSSFVTVKANQRAKIGKSFCTLAPLIGHPFGSIFELQTVPKSQSSTGAQLCRVSDIDSSDFKKDVETPSLAPNANSAATEKDNRSLVDNNTAQALSAEEIADLKRSGASGADIIQALVSNSASFQTKTQFSQEKYINKKQKKYVPRVTARKPAAKSVCEAYFAKCPQKIGLLRFDSLALILSMSNIGAYSDALVLDGCGGLPTAAMAERMAGFGTICSTFVGGHHSSIDIIRLFNLDDTTLASVSSAPISELVAARLAARKAYETSLIASASAMECDELVKEEEKGEVGAGERSNGGTVKDVLGKRDREDDEGEGHNGCQKEEDDPSGQPTERNTATAFKIVPGRRASKDLVDSWAQNGFTSLVVAAPAISPSAAAKALLPLLAPSSPFVIYHPYLHPLTECMEMLQSLKQCMALQITEPWLREYQVLPDRTHPHMQMNSAGGYILSGYTLVDQLSNLGCFLN